MKNIRIFISENFHFLVVKFSVYLNRHVYGMSATKQSKGLNGGLKPEHKETTNRITIGPTQVYLSGDEFSICCDGLANSVDTDQAALHCLLRRVSKNLNKFDDLTS